jgi:hypothetical protein
MSDVPALVGELTSEAAKRFEAGMLGFLTVENQLKQTTEMLDESLDENRRKELEIETLQCRINDLTAKLQEAELRVDRARTERAEFEVLFANLATLLNPFLTGEIPRRRNGNGKKMPHVDASLLETSLAAEKDNPAS